jgi:hypothetical protein
LSTDTEGHASETGATTDSGKENVPLAKQGLWSWYIKFFVPIPMRIFLGREDVLFRVHAKVVVHRADAKAGGVTKEEVWVDKEMSVSCLRWDRMIVAAPR